jgi:hypothetical protein
MTSRFAPSQALITPAAAANFPHYQENIAVNPSQMFQDTQSNDLTGGTSGSKGRRDYSNDSKDNKNNNSSAENTISDVGSIMNIRRRNRCSKMIEVQDDESTQDLIKMQRLDPVKFK